MDFDDKSYRDIIVRMHEGPTVFGPPSPFLRQWLEDRQVPSQLIDFLTSNSVRNHIPFANGCGGVSPFEGIVRGDEFDMALLESGLFPIASAINGDYIVVDFLDSGFSAGFVSHDELWEDEVEEPREAYIRAADSINEMLAGISETLWAAVRNEEPLEPFPIDYDGARHQ